MQVQTACCSKFRLLIVSPADSIEHYCTHFESISMHGKSQNYIQNKKLNAWSYLYGHNSIDIKQVSTTFKRKAIGHY